MRLRRLAVWGFVATAFTAVLAAGCGPTVLIPGETIGIGGQGGAGGQGVGGDTTTTTATTTTGPFEGCEAACSQPSNGVDTCSCVLACNQFPGNAKATCAPSVDLQGNLKTKCVCTVNDGFTGICFEKNPAHLCDFELGCCGKYLGK